MAASGMGMNDETVARIGLNEAAFRFANEERNRLAEEAELGELLLVCECGYAGCSETISVTPEEYRRVRVYPDQVFFFSGPQNPAGGVVGAGQPRGRPPQQHVVVGEGPGPPAPGAG